MKQRIWMLVVLFGLVVLLAGAYAFGAQQPAQTCREARDILIVTPHDTQNGMPGNGGNAYTVDTFTAPAFDRV